MSWLRKKTSDIKKCKTALKIFFPVFIFGYGFACVFVGIDIVSKQLFSEAGPQIIELLQVGFPFTSLSSAEVLGEMGKAFLGAIVYSLLPLGILMLWWWVKERKYYVKLLCFIFFPITLWAAMLFGFFLGIPLICFSIINLKNHYKNY